MNINGLRRKRATTRKRLGERESPESDVLLPRIDRSYSGAVKLKFSRHRPKYDVTEVCNDIRITG